MTVDLTEREDSRDRAVGVVLALTASSMLGVTLAFARVALGARGVVPHVGWGIAVTVGWVIFPSPGLSRGERSSSSVKASRERTPASGRGVGSATSVDDENSATGGCGAGSVANESGRATNESMGDVGSASAITRESRRVPIAEREFDQIGRATNSAASPANAVAPGNASVRTLTTRFIEGVFVPLRGRLGGGALIALLELALILRSTSPLLTALFGWHAVHAALTVFARDATTHRLVTRFTALSWFAVALAVWGLA